MTSIRSWICLVLTLILAAVTFPAMAQQSQNKTFGLVMSVVPTSDGSVSRQVQAVITNTSPNQSSSTFSSVDLSPADLGWSLDSSVTVYETNAPLTFYPADTTSQPGHIIVSNLAPLKPVGKSGNALVITFSVTAASCGDGTYNANVWSGSQIGSGNIFTQNQGQNIASVACQKLACDQGTLTAGTPGQVTVIRDSFNKDGTSSGNACGPVSYYASDTFNNNVNLPPYILHFRWDTTTAATAAFQYDVFYQTTPTHPQVGWLYLDGTAAINPGANPDANPSNPVVFIDPPDCMTPASGPAVLLASDGSLNSPLSATSTTVKINTSTGSFPPLPFPIVIGTERMQVVAFASNGWTVAPRNGVSHPKNALIMSTPLPLLLTAPITTRSDGVTVIPPDSSPYKVNMQAQICKVMSGTTPDTNVPFVEYIDIGDAWPMGR